MKYPNTLQSLVNIANWLDQQGQTKMADAIDHAINLIASVPGAEEAFKNKCQVCGEDASDKMKGLCEKHSEKLKGMTEEQKQMMSPSEKKTVIEEETKKEKQKRQVN